MPFQYQFEFIFGTIFEFLQLQQNNVIVMAVYLLLHGLVIILRFAVFLGCRGHSMLLNVDLHPAKSLRLLSDTAGIKSPLLRRVVLDYIAVAEKNAPRVPLATIVDKHLLDLSLIGMRYVGLNFWTEKLENGLIFLGLILMFIFPQFGIVYGIIAVAGFILLKLSAAFFNYDVALKLLEADIHLYVEREIGQFFAGHMASAVSNFRDVIGEKLSCLEDLPKAIEAMQLSNERYALHHEAFVTQCQIIKDAQQALEKSLASYETTLQNLVQNMGSGIGAFVELHGKNSAASLSTSMQEHINRVTDTNRQTISAITALTEQIAAQSRDISSHLRTLHERMNEI